MGNLWFENSLGMERLIAGVDNWHDVHRSIREFIDQCNIGKAKDKKFKSYYTRIWRQEDGRWRIDVGSHTEFFITDIPYEVKDE